MISSLNKPGMGINKVKETSNLLHCTTTTLSSLLFLFYSARNGVIILMISPRNSNIIPITEKNRNQTRTQDNQVEKKGNLQFTDCKTTTLGYRLFYSTQPETSYNFFHSHHESNNIIHIMKKTKQKFYRITITIL